MVDSGAVCGPCTSGVDGADTGAVWGQSTPVGDTGAELHTVTTFWYHIKRGKHITILNKTGSASLT